MAAWKSIYCQSVIEAQREEGGGFRIEVESEELEEFPIGRVVGFLFRRDIQPRGELLGAESVDFEGW